MEHNANSNKHKYKSILEHTDTISPLLMQKYINGKLSDAERHQVEKHLLNCPLSAEALEGLQKYGKNVDIPKITKSLNREIRNYSKNRAPQSLIQNRRPSRYALAAALSFIFLATIGAWYAINNFYAINSEMAYDMQTEQVKHTEEQQNSIQEEANDSEDSQQVPKLNNENTDDKQQSQSTNTMPNARSDNNAQTNPKSTQGINPKQETKISNRNDIIEERSADADANYDYFEKQKTTQDNTENSMQDVSKTNPLLSQTPVVVDEIDKTSLLSDNDDIEEIPKRKRTVRSTRKAENKQNQNAQLEKESIIDKLTLGIEAYEKGEYKNAETLLNEYTMQNNNAAEAFYYLAMAQLKVSKVEQAMHNFEKVVQIADPDFKEEAQWRKAKILIHQKNNGAAIVLLEQIIKQKGKYAIKAKQELEDLH
ncbi:MAG: zf-HC2 domain-containing protein [Bernardetiaceae bacterium]|nr:zf-HC2 domain-containing protein [Bernardetiaceae bacterium]